MAEFAIKGTVRARPETVFDVYTDHRGYAKLIAPISAAELEREGEPAPNGIGAIRVLRMRGATVREEVTGFDRPGRYSYRMLSGAPLDRFEATVTFEPHDGDTAVTYRVALVASSRPIPAKYPAEGAIRLFMRNAAKEAERRASDPSGERGRGSG